VHGCKQGMPASQKILYELFYGYALSICLRYTKDYEQANEVMNDGFVKVFKSINGFIEPENEVDLTRLFMGWLKRIMINTGINHFKSGKGVSVITKVENRFLEVERLVQYDTDKLAYEDLIKLIQKLSPAYRNTFCMYVIDGYKHEEIAGLLGITVGASKSNLLKARKNLRKMLEVVYAQKV